MVARAVGISQGHYSLIETGRVITSQANRRAIESVVGPVNWLAVRGLLHRQEGLMSGREHADQKLRWGLAAFQSLGTREDREAFLRLARVYLHDLEQLEGLG
jgi:hypothetical protein